MARLDEPVHLPQDSLFSTSSGWTNYRGFFNLAFLLLVISNGRVALENLIKYGVLISPLQWLNSLVSSSPGSWPNLTIVLCSNITILFAFSIEKLLAKRVLSNATGAILYIILLSIHLTLPPKIILDTKEDNPLYSFWALTVVVIEALKLISYAHVNYWKRIGRGDQSKRAAVDNSNGGDHKQKQNDGDDDNDKKRSRKSSTAAAAEPMKYPSPTTTTTTTTNPNPSEFLCYPFNLTLGNLYYFMLAPTLCYELNFPRTPSRRKSFIIKRIIELISFTFVSVALCQQWVIPLVKNSMAPFSKMDVKRCIERVLKLAIPNHLIWLMFFYLYFHSFLNLIAEIMRFADREFYLDFWNSESVSIFWKSWNIPVHRWAVRHVYKPFVRNGFDKFTAAFVVFAISAFLHEYLVSIPLKMFRLWACAGMLAQLPLSILTDRYLKGGRAGNIIVWLSLILGQPMAILMYVHDWYLEHHPELHKQFN